ncbi:MAG: Anthranilate phosphoribosyltransferase [Candidatus Magnetoglobus multicellularis str. Araruama]|uniref:Anthranilate phosphoribosyltransferase n=1 Tax=Candidatus Magnetoglobus multicellularis str. Araruama TaxID=890399 RepID=A0A1V1P9R0_9BACT|nr:MAG: Anthranilate phosphoribosyltransferase [Candidatus Magnetoglobus multicellularis str. Araruama]
MDIKEAIAKAVSRENLAEDEMMTVIDQITDGNATPAQIGALLAALRMKGETVDEITGAARVMRKKCIPIPTTKPSQVAIDRDDITLEQETVVDTCGTGGDGTKTFNISTTTAFVVAGAGLKVAKHGNRSVSSLCGSADVIENLGVNLDLTPEQVGQCIQEVGIGFLFAPLLHGAMRYVIGPRREIGMRTIFNVLGPLTNPARASVQVLGVYEKSLTEKLAGVLNKLGAKSAFVVHGEGSYDEISITGTTHVTQLKNKAIRSYKITPESMGMAKANPKDILGGNAQTNASITRNVLSGEKGPCRDIVLLNAAAAFIAAEKANDFREGIDLAARSIDSGAANDKLEKLIHMSSSFTK